MQECLSDISNKVYYLLPLFSESYCYLRRIQATKHKLSVWSLIIFQLYIPAHFVSLHFTLPFHSPSTVRSRYTELISITCLSLVFPDLQTFSIAMSSAKDQYFHPSFTWLTATYPLGYVTPYGAFSLSQINWIIMPYRMFPPAPCSFIFIDFATTLSLLINSIFQ